MTEALEGIEQNVVGVQQPLHHSRQQVVHNRSESGKSVNENLLPSTLERRFCVSNQLSHDSKKQRQKIDKLVELLVQEPIMSDLETDYIFDNAKLRLQYLLGTIFVKTTDSKNEKYKSNVYPFSQLLSWEAKKKIFGIWVGQDRYFPAFQFEQQKPNPILEQILNLLPKDMHGWHIAFWFSSDNGWLGWDAPQNCLSQVESILKAAKQEALDMDRF